MKVWGPTDAVILCKCEANHEMFFITLPFSVSTTRQPKVLFSHGLGLACNLMSPMLNKAYNVFYYTFPTYVLTHIACVLFDIFSFDYLLRRGTVAVRDWDLF